MGGRASAVAEERRGRATAAEAEKRRGRATAAEAEKRRGRASWEPRGVDLAGRVAEAEESGPGELLRPIESEESGAGRVAG